MRHFAILYSAAGKLSSPGGRASKLRDCWERPGVERSSAARIQGHFGGFYLGGGGFGRRGFGSAGFGRRSSSRGLLHRIARALAFALPPAPVLQPWWSQHSLVAAGDRCRRALRSPPPPHPPPRSVLILMRFLLRSPGAWAWPFMLVQVVLVARRHLHRTSPQDRARVPQLLRKSRGRPARLTPMNGRIYSKPFGA
jgi:hypothetical protein